MVLQLHHIDIPQIFPQNQLKTEFQSWSLAKRMYTSNFLIYFEILTVIICNLTTGTQKMSVLSLTYKQASQTSFNFHTDDTNRLLTSSYTFSTACLNVSHFSSLSFCLHFPPSSLSLHMPQTMRMSDCFTYNIVLAVQREWLLNWTR